MKFRIATTAVLAVALFAVEASAASEEKKTAKTAEKPVANSPAAAPFMPKDPLAVVDGIEIKIAEVEKVIGSLLAGQGGALKDVPAEMRPELYRNVLDGVIVEKLVTQRAAKIEVSDAEVAAELAEFRKQFPDEKVMAEQLAKNGQTPDGMTGEIRRFIQQNRWMEGQLQGKIEVTEAEAQEFFKANPDHFKKPEQVRASHILLTVKPDAAAEEVKAKKASAEKILARVKKGEPFDKLATELSEDPSAKENHGDLEFFEKEQMVPEFSTAAFAMKKGEVSEQPVRSEYGFHIIKVTDRKGEGNVAFDEAKPQLLAFLQQQKRQEEMGKVLRELREGAKVTINLPEAP
jgi:peptidyl-prolyl cis-trans isomerase C